MVFRKTVMPSTTHRPVPLNQETSMTVKTRLVAALAATCTTLLLFIGVCTIASMSWTGGIWA